MLNSIGGLDTPCVSIAMSNLKEQRFLACKKAARQGHTKAQNLLLAMSEKNNASLTT